MGRFSKHIGMGLAGLFAAGLASGAQAQDCPPLTKFVSVKLETLPNSKRVLVPVTINNVPRKFLLDTAGISGLITKESADELNLPHSSGVGQIRLVKTFGIGGRTYELPANETNDTTLISPEYPVSPDRDGNIDGTLTNAFLLNKGELDIDFPNGTLSLFSPDHCPGKINYWGAPDLGYLPLSHAPLDLQPRNARFDPASSQRIPFGIRSADLELTNDIAHLTVPVTLDGHKLNAWIDTSAEKSSISDEVAARIFQLAEKDLGSPSTAKVTPEAALGFYNPHYLGDGFYARIPHTEDTSKLVFKAPVYRHKFSSLTVGHVDIKNLELLIIPEAWGRNNDAPRYFFYTPRNFGKNVWNLLDMAAVGNDRNFMSKDPRFVSTFSNASKDVPDMVLGMDVLRHLHIYLALKENRMYFSVGATAPAPPPAPVTVAQ
ncbi:MAG TPA: hypothetical protein VGM26_02080 [Rhizomicrobium sp.]|jgi:hypothetical protein